MRTSMKNNRQVPLSRRACDACKRRKIKCDGALPSCAFCRISALQCTFEIAPKKRGRKPANNSTSSPASQLESPEPAAPLHLAQASDKLRVSYLLEPGAEAPIKASDSLPLCVIKRAREIKSALLTKLQALVPSTTPLNIVDKCIRLFTQYQFSAAPLCHEPSLWQSANQFFKEPQLEAAAGQDALTSLRAYTLLSALCASIASIHRDAVIGPQTIAVSAAFYTASRETFQLYEDIDLEYPDSSSLSVRSLHSSAIQQLTGKSQLAHRVVGQARLLALDLRLYDEASLASYPPLEAQLLRNNFWHLLTSDHTAAALGTRPYLLHEALFDPGLTVNPYQQEPTPMLDYGRYENSPQLEKQVLDGFYMGCRMRHIAAKLMWALRSKSRDDRYEENDDSSISPVSDLPDMWNEFSHILDDYNPTLPLKDGGNLASSQQAFIRQYQNETLFTQTTQLRIAMHALRMAILRHCIVYKVAGLLGPDWSDESLLVSRVVEGGRDFVSTLIELPVHHLQIMGEPWIEQIRLAGSVLLELSQNQDSDVKEEAGVQLTRLVDVLSRLNSKATDELVFKGV
ncbi:hypothetical protein NW759_008069 [Fusarium solani]|nr:hypothetical protein NW759_008069 [Fusarium solani]